MSKNEGLCINTHLHQVVLANCLFRKDLYVMFVTFSGAFLLLPAAP